MGGHPLWQCLHQHHSLAGSGETGLQGTGDDVSGLDTLTVEGLPDVVKCPDGSTAPGAINFRWYDDLTGSRHTASTTQACGQPPQAYDTFNFTLTKV